MLSFVLETSTKCSQERKSSLLTKTPLLLLSDLQLCDLMASGQQFTWMNKREEDSFVMERLDKAFASTEWINHYHLYYLRNLPIIKSDHGPVILDFEHQTPFRNRPFRFEQMWITHPSCKDMVSKAWEWQSSGSRAAKLRNKLNNIKTVARKWNREVFGRVEIDIK